MEFKKIIKKTALVLFLPLGIIISYIASKSPYLVEEFYSNGIYRLISQVLSNITGIFPFSLGEFLYVSIIILFIYNIVATIVKLFKKTTEKKYTILNFISNAIAFLSITYFVFIIIWGLNYHRLPFSDIAGLDTKPASAHELAALCDHLIERGNELREKINEDSSGIMKLSYDDREVFIRASEGYERAAKIYSQLGGKYGNPKGVILSRGLSISGIGGVYFPFTAEANVNIEMPDSILPSTACHEMAHQRGFAREDEANFIAYLTCNLHSNIEFQYSGTLLALNHSMRALYKYDNEKYIELRKKYCDGISRDLKFTNDFWKSHEGPMERLSSELNNAYLKSNYQSDGIHSYGRMVDLLIAEYRAKMSANP